MKNMSERLTNPTIEEKDRQARLKSYARRTAQLGMVGSVSGVVLASARGHSPLFYSSQMGLSFALMGAVVYASKELVGSVIGRHNDVKTGLAGGVIGGVLIGSLRSGVPGALTGAVVIGGLTLISEIAFAELRAKRIQQKWESHQKRIFLPLLNDNDPRSNSVSSKSTDDFATLPAWIEKDANSNEIIRMRVHRPWPTWLPIRRVIEYPRLALDQFDDCFLSQKVIVEEAVGIMNNFEIARFDDEELETMVEKRLSQLKENVEQNLESHEVVE